MQSPFPVPRVIRHLLAAGLLAASLGVHAERVVTIGLAVPLSGPSGSTGASLEQAAQLAIDDLNAARPVIDGEPVRFALLAQDDRADPRTGELVADYFVKSRVAAVVGHWNSGVGIPASRIYAAAGIVQVAPAVTSPAYTQQGYAGAFRIVPHDGEGARHIAQYVVREMKAANVVVIDDRTPFGAGYAAEFAGNVVALGGKIGARFALSSKSSDFNGILRTVRSLKPDAVLFAGLDAQAAQLVSEMRRLQIGAPLIGIGGLVGPTFVRLAGSAGEGTVVLEPGPASYRGPQWTHFEAAWKARYQEPITLYAPFAYDAVRVIAAAMRQANATGGAPLARELHRIRYRGVTGPIAFDREGNLRDPVFTLYGVKQGRWQVIKTIDERS
ncbi:branched-chain amino acid ABC transporter substrate-binding protein [Herbaspirillum sp. YR522]|uniref:branched-chain amino acid ABC transporter substrate-binding protein n=1 Tax=Herbaspirillum sp. YR522 TaxID=1144342 RepID=UPI00026F8844|nr:branched-chain amino acid ABC transporter substrate-binding protein [Herbaspirillum sp. YR522]EJN06939.1 ABC-type branched-chain amino acid transport system, periplasmic component [Herbaspirillum sp. YR522]